jgi:site-specific DNA-adenine methylase
MKQGTRANRTGNALERVIENALRDHGYTYVDKKKFEQARYLEQPIFTRQFLLCKSIYGTQLKCDFIVFHPVKHPDCLVIEAKWQQANGSVDEKFPYLVMNIREQYPYAAIVVLDGGGFKEGAKEWLRRQVDDKLVHVFNMMEFQRWTNGDEF